MRLNSQIIIATNVENVIKRLNEIAKSSDKFVYIVREGKFLVEDVKLAIEKAYMASQDRTIIVLAADSFGEVVQNRLLKIIEEPPPNKEFILIFPSKSIILPTVRSRLPIVIIDEVVLREELSLDVPNLDLRSVYNFVHENARTDSTKVISTLETIIKNAIKSQRFDLDDKSLTLFEDSIKVLDKGSPPAFVLTAVLLKLLARKRKKYGHI